MSSGQTEGLGTGCWNGGSCGHGGGGAGNVGVEGGA